MTQSNIGNILLHNWRIAFAHGLWTSTQVNGQGKPAYSASFLAPPNHPDIAQAMFPIGSQSYDESLRTAPSLQQVIQAVANAKWGEQGGQVLQSLIAGGRICLRDGNAKPDIAGYPGNVFISARCPTKPNVYDQNGSPVSETDGAIYSGCYVNVRLNIWAMQNQHGRRINAQLAAVQKQADGEPLAGGGAAGAEDFGAIEQAAQAGSEFGDLFGGNQPPQQQPNQLIPGAQPDQLIPGAQPDPNLGQTPVGGPVPHTAPQQPAVPWPGVS